MREGLGEAQGSSDELSSRPGFLCIVVCGSERGGKLPEKKLHNLLQAPFDDLAAEPSYYITRVQTFVEVRVLAQDRGFVVTMADGSEYRVTIAASWGVGADAWASEGPQPF